MGPDERLELRRSVRHLLDQASSSEAVRACVDGPPGHDPELWLQMASLGYTGIHVPEQLGGAGAGHVELAVVLHELGRHITPGPFFASAVLATAALLRAQNDRLLADVLPRLVEGKQRGTVALASADGHVGGSITMRWTSDAGGIRLSGSSAFAPEAHVADVLIVAARSEHSEPVLALVESSADGLTVEPTPTIDVTRRVCRITARDVVVPADRLLCEPGPAAAAMIEQLIATGALALMADATGVAERVLEDASEYAKQRMQFGRPIGSFQAVKHHCANMLVAVECSRAAVAAGIEALDDPDADVPLAAAVTKSYVGPACAEVGALGIQVHGGIGFTWEHDSHLYLKRAKLDEAWFGTPSWHRRRLARSIASTSPVKEEP